MFIICKSQEKKNLDIFGKNAKNIRVGWLGFNSIPCLPRGFHIPIAV